MISKINQRQHKLKTLEYFNDHKTIFKPAKNLTVSFIIKNVEHTTGQILVC